MDLDVEQFATLQTRLAGEAVAYTVASAPGTVGVTADHLLQPIESLCLDEGTVAILRHGCERFMAGDHISATHILIPHVEDVLRQQLRALGVHTTEFKRDPASGIARTDDATLGALMRKTLPDGRIVREYLGPDLWVGSFGLDTELADGSQSPERFRAWTGAAAALRAGSCDCFVSPLLAIRRRTTKWVECRLRAVVP